VKQYRAFAVCPKLIDRCGEDKPLRASVLYPFLHRSDLQFCVDQDERVIGLYTDLIRNAGQDKRHAMHEWLDLMSTMRRKDWYYVLPVKHNPRKSHEHLLFALAAASERGKVVVAASQAHYTKHAAGNEDVRVIEGGDLAHEISDAPAPPPRSRGFRGFSEQPEAFPQAGTMIVIKKGGKMSVKNGDTISAINSVVVNRAKVEGHINNISASGENGDAKALLERLLKMVEASGSAEAGELLESFTQEAAAAKPKKTTLRSLWEGLKSALPSLKEAVGLAADVQRMFL
jgi:hypothetical protein